MFKRSKLIQELMVTALESNPAFWFFAWELKCINA